jgi:carbon monoxide dehydrogenase subunit G
MRISLIFAAALAASPAQAEVIASTDSGFVVSHAADIAAEPAAVWKMLIAPAQWWSSDHTYSGKAENLYLDAQATGCFCEKLPRPADAPETQRMGSVEHMHIVYADPQRGVLRMTGGLGPLQAEAVSAVMTIALKQEGAATRLTMRYVVGGVWQGKPAELGPLVDRVLGEQVQRLAAKFAPQEPLAEPPAKP